ncbi:MAG TPA: bifunctional response regulator/alkaline phosphatase family protein [Candidatus Krumholzibacteria bacterium]|nr:bifunctional response regulator/alkaline phosphatase family protein [Candidatus Krumholzibacteria bacterium]
MAFRILWVDDNIEELRSHVMYLGGKGYEIDGATNGRDAIAMLAEKNYDAILLDEMMPGMGGLETLEEMRKVNARIPVIMITKSEAEDLMTRAIGKRIDDYLVKPVSPLQILSALKRQLEARKLTGETVMRDYMAGFMAVSDRIGTAATPADWESIYVDLVSWGMDIFQYSDHGLLSTHADQMSAANLAFARYVRANYRKWIRADGATGVGAAAAAGDVPLLSPRLYETWIEPEVQRSRQVFWILIDCMRLDQVRMVEPLLETFYHVERRNYWSILPTATPYARNALFSGLYPLDIAEGYPQWWIGDPNHEGSRNAHEAELLDALLRRLKSPAAGSSRYYKVSDARDTDHLHRNLGSMGDVRLVAGVYNFLDIMAHGRSQNRILKELAPDEAAFRTLMRSWFEHSNLWDVLRSLARRDCTVILTTDHGSMLCQKAVQIRGNRDTSSNVRYKFGDNLGVDEDKVLLMKNPEEFRLPRQSPIENYAVTTESNYLVYPTNFHEYERLYRDSFQHGGISLEEMICPFIVLRPR